MTTLLYCKSEFEIKLTHEPLILTSDFAPSFLCYLVSAIFLGVSYVLPTLINDSNPGSNMDCVRRSTFLCKGF